MILYTVGSCRSQTQLSRHSNVKRGEPVDVINGEAKDTYVPMGLGMWSQKTAVEPSSITQNTDIAESLVP
jgi:hypothetical protein